MEEVRIWEEATVIPTYEVGKADKNPMFLEKRVYQGSSGKIYPYPTTQEISRSKTNRTYQAVYLENQYLKIMILPELGGRIQRAYDKTNQYDFVYYNHVIKPALVGLLGPWISGGIEFNWPQHHRPTTFMPVDHELVENKDGSKSLLISDVDQINGTKEVTYFTLYPDQAFIEIKGQLYNRTPLPQTFLWWANPAVAVNDYTQSIFPPDVHSVYDHGRRAVSSFPVATGEYYKHDYSEGVDISRYKNIPVPTSYMAEHSDYDFVGGYDYRRQAGLLHVADHHVSTGKKQWTWGCGEFGQAWDRNLTDSDGPYIELMTGMFCDNQPDFSWLKPYEEKTFTQYFMPYKAVGPVKNATIHALLNMEVSKDGLYICAYGTSRYEGAEVVVTYGGDEIFRKKITLSPVDIYEELLPLAIEDQYRTKVSIIYQGDLLVSYQPQDPGIPKLAEPAKTPAAPGQVMTNEELYLIGQHIEQYRHATWLPDDYYLEGLKRDPGDIRINNAYGLLLFRRGCFEEAEGYFKKAIERLTELHPNPYFGEPFYNLGLALFYQEKFDAAYDAFFKATWTDEEQERAFYYLAAIDTRRGDYQKALNLVDKGLVKNVHNVKARGLKAIILAKLGRMKEAKNYIKENLQVDPFDYVSRFEEAFLNGGTEEGLAAIRELDRDFHEPALAAARDFAESGCYEEAIRVLRSYRGEDKPLLHYYAGFYFSKLGRGEEAAEEWQEAEEADPTYTFPNKPEDIQVLTGAIKAYPKGAKAYYYLGCLYYDKLQYDRSINLWERAERLDSAYPTLERNLAIAYFNKRKDPEKALDRLEKAFTLDPTDAQIFLELDQLHKKLGYRFEDRLADYQKYADLYQNRDDIYTEYVTVLNEAGRYQEAYDAIMAHQFQTWEGAEGKISTQFKTALLELAKEAMERGDFKCARAHLKEALSYPLNLGEGRLEGTKDNHLYYFLGVVHQQLGEDEEAKACFRKATLGDMEPAGMLYYYDQPADMILYQGLAFEKLGDQRQANTRFYKLIDYGERHIRDSFKMDYFAVSMPDFAIFDDDMDRKNVVHCYYLMGLGKLGLKRTEEAHADFEKALKLDPNHQNAAIYLKLCI